MLVHCSRVGTRSRGLRLLAAAFAAGLALSAPGARAQTGASLDIQAANNALTTEQFVAQFYNANSGKSYLTGVVPVTPAPATPSPVVYPSGGINQPGISTGSTDGTPLSATLSGSGETPAVATAASGSASFLLSKDQRSMSYQITITGLTGPATAVRIRQGPPGQSGGIILYSLGALSGDFEVRPEDVSTFLSGGTFLEVTTDQFPAGEIRGQITVGAGSPAPVVTPPVVTPSPGVVVPAGIYQVALQSIVSEVRAGHNAHVAALQQLLGTNAAPIPTFQNLDAPTLTQFLTMAQAFEDFAVGANQYAVDSVQAQPATGTTGAVPAVNQSLRNAVVAILADDGHYAGGIRAFEKLSSTALGGNPNVTLTETGQPFNPPRTPAQLNAFLQPYLTGAGNTGTGTGTGTNPGTPSGGTTGTGTNPSPGPY
jgi:CHRD domain-containing protein/ferritin-like protein